MPKTRVIAYLRVSTEKQVDTGSSLDAQRAKVLGYAALYDLNIVAVTVEAGASAKSLERPELQLALARLKRGEADALLVTKVDRLTRSVADLGRLIEEHFGDDGADLLCVEQPIDTRSSGGRLVLNLLASVSQWERESIGERTAEIMQHMAAEGRHTGGEAPYGYALSACGRARKVCARLGGCALPAAEHGILVPIVGEQEAIAMARALRSERLSLRAIGRRLAQAGHLSRVGTVFEAQQISRMVD